MGMEKAIEHGKEHRKPFLDWRAVSHAARNHGKDPDWQSDRTYKNSKREESAKEQKREYERGE